LECIVISDSDVTTTCHYINSIIVITSGANQRKAAGINIMMENVQIDDSLSQRDIALAHTVPRYNAAAPCTKSK